MVKSVCANNSDSSSSSKESPKIHKPNKEKKGKEVNSNKRLKEQSQSKNEKNEISQKVYLTQEKIDIETKLKRGKTWLYWSVKIFALGTAQMLYRKI